MLFTALSGGVISGLLALGPTPALADEYFWLATGTDPALATSWKKYSGPALVNPANPPSTADDVNIMGSSPAAPTFAFTTGRTSLPAFASGSFYSYNSMYIGLPPTIDGTTGEKEPRVVTVAGAISIGPASNLLHPPPGNSRTGSFTVEDSGLVILAGGSIESNGIKLEQSYPSQPLPFITNSGDLIRRENATGNDAYMQIEIGTLTNQSTGKITMGINNAAAGKVFNNGGLIDGPIVNAGIVVLDGGSVTGKSPDGNAALVASTNTGSFTIKNGAIVSGGLTVNGGTVTNTASTFNWYNSTSSTVSGPVIVNGGTFNNQAGSLLVVGNTLDATGAAFVNGNVTVNAGGTFNNKGIAENANGDLRTLTLAFASGGGNTAGYYGTAYTNLAGVTARIKGDVTNAGTFVNGGLIEGNVTQTDGTFTNEASIRGNYPEQHYLNGIIRGTVTVTGGTFNNSGSIGSVIYSGGAFNNLSGGFIGGSLSQTGGAVSNEGLVYLGTTISGGGTLTNKATGTLRDTLVTGGSRLVNQGVIGYPVGSSYTFLDVHAGSVLLNYGGAIIHGSITTAGDVFTQGTLTGSVNMTGGTFTQRADQTTGIAMSNDARLIVGDQGSNALQTLSGVISGAGSLTKETAGNTVVLSGANTYTGGTVIKGGTLRLDGSGSLGTGHIQVGGGGVLEFNLGANDYTINSLFNALPNIGTVGWSAAADGGLIRKAGTGTLTINGAFNNALGSFEVSGGTVRIGPDATMSAGIAGIGLFGLNFTNVQGTTATFDFGASSRYNNGTFTIVGLSGNTGSTLTGSGSLTLEVENASTKTFSGTISGNLGLKKAGLGTQVLAADSSYTGTTTISAGTLKVTSGGALSHSDVSIASGAILELGSSGHATAGDYTFRNSVSGQGGINKSGTNAVTLTGTNTYFGTTNILEGTLIIGSAGALSSNTRVNIATGATFDPGNFTLNVSSLQGGGNIEGGTGDIVVDSSLTNTFSGTISGDRNLVKLGVGTQIIDGNINITGQATAGGGTLTLTGNNIIGGGVLVTGGGKLVIGGNNAAGGAAGNITTTGSIIQIADGVINATPVVINSNTTQFEIANGETGTQSGVISEIRDPATPTAGRPMEKIGGGTLILTADNTYTGKTTITAGTLQLGNGGATGSTLTSEYAIQTGTTLAINRSGSLGIGALFTGAGDIVMSGTGTVTITNPANTWSGQARVSSGTLAFSGPATFNSFAVSSGGTLSLWGGVIVNNASTISGLGVGDLGALRSAGDNSLLGGLSVAGRGKASIASDSGLLTIAGGLTSASDVAFLGAGTTYLAAATNIPKLEKNGTGTLVLGAANSIAGGVDINEGVVEIRNNGALGTGQVRLSGTLKVGESSHVIANNISLAGTAAAFEVGNGRRLELTGILSDLKLAAGFSKTGLGRLELSALNTYTGTTFVNEGELSVGGSILGNSIVAAGATLTGNGSIGSAQVFGTIAPQQTPGATLTVNGNLTLAAGSKTVFVFDDKTSSKISVNGVTQLGGTVELVALPTKTPYAFFTKYEVLTSTGGVTGKFADLSSLQGQFGPAIRPSVSYGSNSVFVTLDPASILAVVGNRPVTGNQRNFMSAFDRAVLAGANPTAFFPIFTVSPDQLAGATNTLTGEAHTSATSMGMQVSSRFLNTSLDTSIAGRLTPDGAGGGPVSSYAAAPEAPAAAAAFRSQTAPARQDRGYAAWIAVSGSQTNTAADAASGTAKRQGSDGHITAGLDIRFTPNVIAGISFSGGQVRSSLSGGLGSLSADVFQVGLYGLGTFGDFSLSASANYASLNVKSTRVIPVLGLNSVAAEYRAQSLGGRLEASYVLARYSGLTIAPLVALQAGTVTTPSFQEYNNGAPVGVTASGNRNNAVRTELGVKLSANGMVGGIPVKGFAKFAWANHVLAENGFSAALTGLQGSNFTINGPRSARNAALVELGLDAKLGPSISFGVTGSSDISRTTRTHIGRAQLKVDF